MQLVQNSYFSLIVHALQDFPRSRLVKPKFKKIQHAHILLLGIYIRLQRADARSINTGRKNLLRYIYQYNSKHKNEIYTCIVNNLKILSRARVQTLYSTANRNQNSNLAFLYQQFLFSFQSVYSIRYRKRKSTQYNLPLKLSA